MNVQIITFFVNRSEIKHLLIFIKLLHESGYFGCGCVTQGLGDPKEGEQFFLNDATGGVGAHGPRHRCQDEEDCHEER